MATKTARTKVDFNNRVYENTEAIPAYEFSALTATEPYPFHYGSSNYDEQAHIEHLHQQIEHQRALMKGAQFNLKQAQIQIVEIKSKPILKDLRKLCGKVVEGLNDTAEASALVELMVRTIRMEIKSGAYERFVQPKKEAIRRMREERDQPEFSEAEAYN